MDSVIMMEISNWDPSRTPQTIPVADYVLRDLIFGRIEALCFVAPRFWAKIVPESE
ncbi:MAG TPA: hypothetical protein VEF90_07290 [Xanthobacteraceae bacterium]|nr:hypothetical protein [Xanthobacteraceae bacterium]